VARLNVAFVIKALAAGPGGGAERVLAAVASSLAERGHKVTVITFDPASGKDFYPVSDRVARVRLGVGPTIKRSGPIDTARRLVGLRATVRSLGPDVTVGFMHSSFIPLAFALAGTGRRVVGSERTSYAHYQSHPMQSALLHLSVPLIPAMTANAEGVRRGYPTKIRRRMTVIPNPVAPATERANPAVEGPKTLLSVGGFRPEKDHRTLLRAFAKISPEHPDWKLRLVGDGALRQPLQSLALRLNVANRVEFAGTTDCVDAEYAAAQLFVLPSRYEAFPNCLAEALAHGLPAVGFADCPGTNHLISDGVNGLLVEGEDRAAALADALHDLLGSSERRLQLAAEAPASVARYSLQSVTGQWENFLESVIARQPLQIFRLR
jgi:glycosyltransferase involved in cell wall biosynthesis